MKTLGDNRDTCSIDSDSGLVLRSSIGVIEQVIIGVYGTHFLDNREINKMWIMELSEVMVGSQYGPRAYLKQIQNTIIEQDKELEVAEAVIQYIASSVFNASPLIASARKISTKIHRMLQLPIPNEHSLFKLGIEAHNWMAMVGLIDVDKYPTIEKDKVKVKWYVVSVSEEFSEYANTMAPNKLMVSPTEGPRVWKEALYYVNDHRIPIVKKADRYDLLDRYSVDKMPNFYKAVNRLNAQGFRVNRRIYDLALSNFAFTPRTISDDEKKQAIHSLNDITRKAKRIEAIRFKEMNKWLIDKEAGDKKTRTKIASEWAHKEYEDFYDEKSEPFRKTISDWSKRMDFERIIQLASIWRNHQIHYLYQADTRGRLYTVQNYLTPLGSDVAKAMLVFDEQHQVSGYDLCIHIANCFGQDKLAFSDRVEWVNENREKLYEIGMDPGCKYHWIEDLGLDKENKTKWQGLAACMEYRKFIDYVEHNGTEEGFLSNLIIGLDATASGTQILTMLGCDNNVAPYVNVSKSMTNKVGDFYTYLSNFLKPKLLQYTGQSETLDAMVNNWDGYARKLAKRNSMTFSYSGTKYGFGQQQWEDRHSYNKGSQDLTGSNLSRKDCRIIGNEMYEVCLENIRGGAGIMKWLREGIDHIDTARVSWTMPDGFYAFQVCDSPAKKTIEGMVGSRQVNLRYMTFADKPKICEHKNGISPNWVHSFDAYLLRLIVLAMPEEAPISTVHDQFCTASYYIAELQAAATDAYKTIADREVAERICEEAFGIHRELPKAGDWTTEELDNAEFIIC